MVLPHMRHLLKMLKWLAEFLGGANRTSGLFYNQLTPKSFAICVICHLFRNTPGCQGAANMAIPEIPEIHSPGHRLCKGYGPLCAVFLFC